MIKNTVTLSEKDARDIMDALRDLAEMLDEIQDQTWMIVSYKKHLIDLANSVENKLVC